MKCPKTLHLVRTYCTRVLIPEYLNIAIFDSSYSFMNFRAIDSFDAYVLLQRANSSRSILGWKRPGTGYRIRPERI